MSGTKGRYDPEKRKLDPNYWNAKETNLRKYGKGFYAKIGALGGKAGHTGGFYANRELARVAGKLGGQISKRGKAKKAIKIEIPKRNWFQRLFNA